MKSKLGVWAVDDEVALLPPSLASIAKMLRSSAEKGDMIELRKTALDAAEMLTTKGHVQNDCTFRDEIGC